MLNLTSSNICAIMFATANQPQPLRQHGLRRSRIVSVGGNAGSSRFWVVQPGCHVAAWLLSLHNHGEKMSKKPVPVEETLPKAVVCTRSANIELPKGECLE